MKELFDVPKEIGRDLSEGIPRFMDEIADSSIVLLGEASQGTHEYYLLRAKISEYLIREREKGFNFIAVEGDWPDCYLINRFVKHYTDSGDTTRSVLENFNRWPTWMWANWEIAALMEWMYDFNQDKPVNEMAGFYGLDMYSMSESFEAIIGYLKKNDHVALQTALQAMDCVEPYARDSGTSLELIPEDCSDDILEMLVKIRERANLYNADPEASFNMNQNARVVQNAERYYRVMHEIGPVSWNLRDEHMTDTLINLLEYHGSDSKAIVWEHNTHIGDARATDMHIHGLLNVGQLVREKFAAGNTLAVGFGSYQGEVIAGTSWSSHMQIMNVPEAREESWESLLHQVGFQEVMLFSDDLKKHGLFDEFIDHRAIGVVYDPTKDHSRNYVPSRIPERYDAFVFLNKTKALHPLKIQPEKREIPDTYPWEL